MSFLRVLVFPKNVIFLSLKAMLNYGFNPLIGPPDLLEGPKWGTPKSGISEMDMSKKRDFWSKMTIFDTFLGSWTR